MAWAGRSRGTADDPRDRIGGDPSPGLPCFGFDLTWTPGDGATTYRVYESRRMPGTPLPPRDPVTAVVSIGTAGGSGVVTAAYTPLEAQGTCFWAAAANGAGESKPAEMTISAPKRREVRDRGAGTSGRDRLAAEVVPSG